MRKVVEEVLRDVRRRHRRRGKRESRTAQHVDHEGRAGSCRTGLCSRREPIARHRRSIRNHPRSGQRNGGRCARPPSVRQSRGRCSREFREVRLSRGFHCLEVARRGGDDLIVNPLAAGAVSRPRELVESRSLHAANTSAATRGRQQQLNGAYLWHSQIEGGTAGGGGGEDGRSPPCFAGASQTSLIGCTANCHNLRHPGGVANQTLQTPPTSALYPG